MKIIIIGLLIFVLCTAGCATSVKSSNYGCAPVHIDEKYLISGGSCNEPFFVSHCGVIIIRNQAYFISSKDVFDKLNPNETYMLSIIGSSAPDYNYINRICE